jgi:pantoate--beta-alanine ligase
MQVFYRPEDLRHLSRTWKMEGLRVGLVPTMGYLHEGHASLVKKALEECQRVIVSVFVNPTQFAPGEDLDSYPRDFEKDRKLLEDLGVSALFHPDPAEIYPPGFQTTVEVSGLSTVLCGRSRPTHFKGVTTVVLKLFNINEPHRAYFGMKDAQQYFVLRRMVKDLDLDIQLVPCPIVRENDGLAMSSRNFYLSPKERKAAPALHRALSKGQAILENGEESLQKALDVINAELLKEPLIELEYLEAVDTDTLLPATKLEGEILVALAARLGRTRLIDNFLIRRG